MQVLDFSAQAPNLCRGLEMMLKLFHGGYCGLKLDIRAAAGSNVMLKLLRGVPSSSSRFSQVCRYLKVRLMLLHP